ncbi:hypothetical protein ACPW7J_11425 [Ihubacter sp. rT4E-8]|uniref:hypothetical protein n=1 Tax=Ihubacter sp. rT4E-8 TaxID=3242369 RepID=UPI003CEF8CEC
MQGRRKATLFWCGECVVVQYIAYGCVIDAKHGIYISFIIGNRVDDKPLINFFHLRSCGQVFWRQVSVYFHNVKIPLGQIIICNPVVFHLQWIFAMKDCGALDEV